MNVIMKLIDQPLSQIPAFFVVLLLAGTSCFVKAENLSSKPSTHAEKTCLNGWLPKQPHQNSVCLKAVSCFDDDNQNQDDRQDSKKSMPVISEEICPKDLNRAMESDSNVAALVQVQRGLITDSEYISKAPFKDSSIWHSLWYHGWSDVNFAMSLLHFYKAKQKAKLLYSGKTSNKNIYFFISYMTGAFHHLIEMPVTKMSHVTNSIPHYLVHTGVLILSIIERLKDCSCCSQFKNGHNTMIAFHLFSLGLSLLAR